MGGTVAVPRGAQMSDTDRDQSHDTYHGVEFSMASDWPSRHTPARRFLFPPLSSINFEAQTQLVSLLLRFIYALIRYAAIQL